MDYPKLREMEEGGGGKTNSGHPSMIASIQSGSHLSGFGPISAKLGSSLPNSAPDVELYSVSLPPPDLNLKLLAAQNQTASRQLEDGPKKKKYAKEAWPGKKPGSHLLI